MPLGVKDSSLAVIQIIMMQGAEGVAQQKFLESTYSFAACCEQLLVSVRSKIDDHCIDLSFEIDGWCLTRHLCSAPYLLTDDRAKRKIRR